MTYHLAGIENAILSGRWAQILLAQDCDPVAKDFTWGELEKNFQGEENNFADKMTQEFEKYEENHVFHDS